MTANPTYADLIARLEAKVDSGLRTLGGGSVGYGPDGKIKSEMWGSEPIMKLANPDGPEAAAAIRDLVRERDEAFKGCTGWREDYAKEFKLRIAAQDSLSTANARVAELERALQPFAEAASVHDEIGRANDDDDRIWISQAYGCLLVELTESDLYAARQALEGGEQKP